jgi:hypothetical protein
MMSRHYIKNAVAPGPVEEEKFFYKRCRGVVRSSGAVGKKLSETREQSVRSPLKVAIICLFRGIDVQVRIFRLNRAKKAFSAENFSCKCYFCYFHGLKRRGFMVQPVQPKFLLLMPE